MRKTDSTEKLTTLIKAATSPFHTAAAIVKELRTAGFEPLVMNRPWQLEAGGKYYVEQYGSAVVAFTVGDQVQAEGFRIAAAHTDFPGLRVKQQAEILRETYAQLNVEVYGGAIAQIKEKQYCDSLADYKGKILLVGVNYEKKTKKHTCVIEELEE